MPDKTPLDIVMSHFLLLNLEYSFSPMEVAIFIQLVDKSRSINWKNPFGFKCDELRSKVKGTNAESKKAFDTARNKLKQAGLIDFENGGGRGYVTKYTLKGLQNAPLSAPLSEPLSAPLSGSSGSYFIPSNNQSLVVDGVGTPEQNKELALADRGFVETYYQFGLTPERLSLWLDAFHKQLNHDGGSMKPQRDYRKHFGNWIKFQKYMTDDPLKFSPIKASKNNQNDQPSIKSVDKGSIAAKYGS